MALFLTSPVSGEVAEGRRGASTDKRSSMLPTPFAA